MEAPRLMMIGLDGFDQRLAEPMLAAGRLPALRRLREGGAHLQLDHGPAKRTGLAWEHVATGLSPDDAKRWSAVDFDPATYSVVQRPTLNRPFAAGLGRRTLVFDPPYFGLGEAEEVKGMVSWGAHDPGVAQSARPAGLIAEIDSRFGPYPAMPWIYGFVWPSPERTRAMGEDLTRALALRTEVAEWLFAERLPDWELGFMVVSEYHSAIEALWHGGDPSHPLHAFPSGEPARRGLESVYEAGDRLIGRMMERLPDARFAIFNLHGMGPNNADVADMALLPELLYHHSFGRPCMADGPWAIAASGVPIIVGEKAWEDEMDRVLPLAMRRPGLVRRGFSALRRRLGPDRADGTIGLDWMPSARYRRFWPRMKAFALPSFYDGQVRINLEGREAWGVVGRAGYDSACDAVEALLRECRDTRTGDPIVAGIERTARPDRLGPSEADLIITWAGAPLGFDHPVHGRIGPLPYRRPGGHTGDTGIVWLAGPGIRPGDYGTRSAFDLVPTIVDLLGGAPGARLTGESFRRQVAPEPVPA
jgi:predicted AlkP superfamily phosphohydrolase/phosphomutase